MNGQSESICTQQLYTYIAQKMEVVEAAEQTVFDMEIKINGNKKTVEGKPRNMKTNEKQL